MTRPESRAAPVWIFPLIAAIVVALGQWATVTVNYAGNWTALYCTGADQHLPPLNKSENVYLFAHSAGYDGQFYHYIAHDPWMLSDLKSYIDDPALRYRRIFIPLLAYGFAAGRSKWIDPAYELVILIFITLGVYWSSLIARQAGLEAPWGLLFLAMPAVPIAADRLVIDVGLATLTTGSLYYGRSPSWKLFLVLVSAALTRETGLLLIAAFVTSMALRRQFRIAAIFLLSALPAVAWYSYVQTQAAGKPYDTSVIPFSAILFVLKNPWKYAAGTPFVTAVQVADYLALAGMLLGFAFAFYWFARDLSDQLRITAILFAVAGLVLQRTDMWQNVYNFGRVYTPVLVCVSALAARCRMPWLLAPVALILPRVGIQLMPQALGVFHRVVDSQLSIGHLP